MDAEVVVRFAGTLLAVTRVPHGRGYRIGTSASVDLPLDIAPLTAFPLVGSTADGFVVRCPAGVPAVEYTADLAITVSESEIKLAPGSRIDLAFGRVMISVSTAVRGRPVIERPRIDRRPHVFAAVSLAAHLAMLIVAVASADLDDIAIPAITIAPDRRPVHIARFPSEEQKERRRLFSPTRQRAAVLPKGTPLADPVAGAPREQAVEKARHAGFLDPLATADFAALMGKADLAKELANVGPLYDEDAALAQGFGGSARKWDSQVDDQQFGSVKTGRYATVAHGRAAGEFYDIGGGSTRANVRMAMCESTTCTASDAVQSELEKRREDLEDCYERHAPRADHGNVTLTFTIKDGNVDKVRISGLDGVGTCVARVARGVQFPAGTEENVKLPLAFSRS